MVHNIPEDHENPDFQKSLLKTIGDDPVHKVARFTHLISPQAHQKEVARLVDTLENNGYKTADMDFSDLVAQKMALDCIKLITSVGARVKNHSWEYTSHRGLSVKIYLTHDNDVMLAEKMLTN